MRHQSGHLRVRILIGYQIRITVWDFPTRVDWFGVNVQELWSSVNSELIFGCFTSTSVFIEIYTYIYWHIYWYIYWYVDEHLCEHHYEHLLRTPPANTFEQTHASGGCCGSIDIPVLKGVRNGVRKGVRTIYIYIYIYVLYIIRAPEICHFWSFGIFGKKSKRYFDDFGRFSKLISISISAVACAWFFAVGSAIF